MLLPGGERAYLPGIWFQRIKWGPNQRAEGPSDPKNADFLPARTDILRERGRFVKAFPPLAICLFPMAPYRVEVLTRIRRGGQGTAGGRPHRPPSCKVSAYSSSIRPSTDRVTTCQGSSLPQAERAFFRAFSIPPQQGTSIRTSFTDLMSLTFKISVSFSE